MREKCGIVSVIDIKGDTNVVPIAAEIVAGLQHRGQLGAGLASVRDGVINTVKGNGLVRDVLNTESLSGIEGFSAIAHTRYATSGSRGEEFAQPFVHESDNPAHSFAFGFNGNIANVEDARAEMESRGVTFSNDVDTELIRQLLIEHLESGVRQNIGAALKSMESQLDGSFNLAILSGTGETFSYRHATGNRPLVYSVIDGRYVISASEDSAIKRVYNDAATFDIKPGQILRAKANFLVVEDISDPKPARCFFEWVYFAHYLSKLDNVSVQQARYACGQHLARSDDVVPSDSVVVPVPDSAVIAGDGYANTSGMLQSRAITNVMKGRRTFIAEREGREQKAMEKYKIDPNAIMGKNIVLVDDSMVRGTTMKVLIRRLREEGGALEIHLRLASPPILAPCFYGIDFSTTQNLIARKHYASVLSSGVLPDDVLSSIAKDLGVDSVRFLSTDSVKQVLSEHIDGLCMACVDGQYPTAEGQRLYDQDSS